MSRRIVFEFDETKAIEAIIYIAKEFRKLKVHPTRHGISKILYFADKLSLSRYGRLICGGDYYAMTYGPVPSEVYNLMKQQAREETRKDLGFIVEGRDIQLDPDRTVDKDVFSDSDLDCIQSAIKKHGQSSFMSRTMFSHDLAYTKAWNNKNPDADSALMPIEEIVLQFSDGMEVLEYLSRDGTE